MSRTTWKIRGTAGELIAQTRFSEDAAAVVSLHGPGYTVEYATGPYKVVVWHEGDEDFDAGDSYDSAAELMQRRREAGISASNDRARTREGNQQ